MSRNRRRVENDPRPSELAELGLRVGDRVRFRRKPNERWHEASVVGREKDGSLAVRDLKGAARALPVELVEVHTHGPRGAAIWEPLSVRASRTEQLGLW